MKASSFLVACLFLLSGACSNSADSPESGGPVGGKADGFGRPTQALRLGEPDAPLANPAIIGAVALEGDVLLVDVTYGGGCEEHLFDLFWDGSFLESFPVQAQLQLTHGGAPDFCEALISERLRFDLTPLLEAYRDGYGADDTIVLRLGGEAITYEPTPSDSPKALRVGAPDAPLSADGLIQSASIEGDTLVLEVAYGGGCEEHIFDLFWDGGFLESSPVQAQLQLTHGGEPDFCEAFIMETLRFDLTPLREAYERTYGDGDDIILRGLGDSLVYAGDGVTEGDKALRVGTPDAPLAADGLVQGTRLYGSILEVDVAYGGGCEEHIFDLFWDGSFLESFPVQAQLQLTHGGEPDFCEAFIMETLRFDLSVLQEAYKAGYGSGGDIILRGVGSERVVLTVP